MSTNPDSPTIINFNLAKVLQGIMGACFLGGVGWILTTNTDVSKLSSKIDTLTKSNSRLTERFNTILNQHSREIHELQIANEANKLNRENRIKLEEIVRANSTALTNLRITIESRYRINKNEQ